MRLILLLVILTVIGTAVVAGARYEKSLPLETGSVSTPSPSPLGQDSPEITISQINLALKDRDFASFSKYVDIDSVTQNTLNRTMNESKNNPQYALIASIMEEASISGQLSEEDKTRSRTAIEQVVESGSYYDPSFRMNSVSQSGQTASAVLENSQKETLTLTLTDQGNLWRVSDSSSDAKTAYDFIFMRIPTTGEGMTPLSK